MAKMRTPDGLKVAGRKLWRAVTDDYELDAHELALLLQAARAADALDRLHVLVETEGEMIEGPQGKRAHPALVEGRQQALALARLMTALRIPQEGAGSKPGARPQRRGIRGVYAGVS